MCATTIITATLGVLITLTWVPSSLRTQPKQADELLQMGVDLLRGATEGPDPAAHRVGDVTPSPEQVGARP